MGLPPHLDGPLGHGPEPWRYPDGHQRHVSPRLTGWRPARVVRRQPLERQVTQTANGMVGIPSCRSAQGSAGCIPSTGRRSATPSVSSVLADVARYAAGRTASISFACRTEGGGTPISGGTGGEICVPLPSAPFSTSSATIHVILAAAHLDNDPGNSSWRNLKCLCQRCHMLHDRPYHRAQRWLTYRMRWALGDLFTGPYPAGFGR